jgi:hypothetical protein
MAAIALVDATSSANSFVRHVIARTLDWHGPFPSAPVVPPVSDQIAAPVHQRPPFCPLSKITFELDMTV